MTNDIKETLFSEEHLTEITRNLSKRISEDYKGENSLMVSVLKGSFVFMADLTHAIDIPCRVSFMSVSSCGARIESSGMIKTIKDLGLPPADHDLLVVEDILDSDIILSYILELLQPRDPKSIKICTLFDKPERHTARIMVDCVGTHVPDEFIVGYGLDYNETHQNLPYTSILKPHVYGG